MTEATYRLVSEYARAEGLRETEFLRRLVHEGIRARQERQLVERLGRGPGGGEEGRAAPRTEAAGV